MGTLPDWSHLFLQLRGARRQRLLAAALVVDLALHRLVVVGRLEAPDGRHHLRPVQVQQHLRFQNHIARVNLERQKKVESQT